MAIVAIYSSKGGVGKTTLAVNLAWASATLSSRRTLLWDLDAQAAASFILAPDRPARQDVHGVIARDVPPEERIVTTNIPNLDLLPADASLRTLDLQFAELDANKRVRRIGEALSAHYDRIVIDCPPGLGVTADQIIRSAALIVLPMIPSSLAMRAADELCAHLSGRRKPGPPVLPVFNLVDRRRSSHCEALAAAPGQAAVPMASAVEQMAVRHAPLGAYAPKSPAAEATRALWLQVEQRLARRPRNATVKIPATRARGGKKAPTKPPGDSSKRA